jgi:hypothetical protein
MCLAHDYLIRAAAFGWFGTSNSSVTFLDAQGRNG